MHRRPQKTTSARRWSLLVLGAVLLLSAVTAFEINASCNEYWNSEPYCSSGACVCAGEGWGCTECVDDEGNSCVTNGNQCQPRQQYYW